MIENLLTLSASSRFVAAIALDIVLKATLLYLLALGLHIALGRRRALVRSGVWHALLIGLLVLPVVTLAFPRLRIECLPAPSEPIEATIAKEQPVAFRGETPSDRLAAPDLIAPRSGPTTFSWERPFDPSFAPGWDGAMPSMTMARAEAPSVSVPPPALAEPRESSVALDIIMVVLALYALGAALRLLRLAVSLAAVARLRRSGVPVEDACWTEALERWRRRLKIARPVALVGSERVNVPLVLGWLRPTIMLPKCPTWPVVEPRHRDAILLHELAHVRRGDYLWNLVQQVVHAVYWVHPLAWLSGRLIASVREQACDDLCVFWMDGSRDYQTTLLDIASGLVHRPSTSLGLAMARSSQLGRRLSWIDRSPGAPRCLLRWPARLALAGTVMVLTALLGSIELARATANAVEEPKETSAKSDEEPKADPAAQSSAIEVVVLAKDSGEPLEGATVRPTIDFATYEQKTGPDGRVRIDLSGRRFRDSLNLDVWADGYVQQRHYFAQNDTRYPKIPRRITIELLPGEETFGGTVTNEEGQPIAGVKVGIWGYLGEKKEEHELAYMVDAVTDEQGQWRCRSFRTMKFAYLYLSHPDYLSDDQYHPRRFGRPRPTDSPSPDERPIETLRDFSDVQVMIRGVEVTGRVTDERGEPILGAEVGWLEADRRNTFHSGMPTAMTDTDGGFRFPHVRPGRVVLQVKAQGHAPVLKPVEAQKEMEPVSLVLGPPRTLSGRVVDSQGKPIPEALVNIDSWRGYRALGVYFKTDAEGRFHWEDAPPDSVLVNASHAGFDRDSQRASPDDPEVILILNRSLLITGRIRDAETGEPVDRAGVEVGIPDQETGEYSWSTDRRVSSFQGSLLATLDAEKTPEYRLRITAKGYEPFESRTFRSDEGQVEYNVELTKSDEPQEEAVSGVVRRPDGMPLEGADVTVTYPLALGRSAVDPSRLPVVRIENGTIRPNQSLTVTKTGAGGRFTLTREPDPAGQYYAVVVIHPDFYAEVNRSAFEADSTIVAKPWGRVEGVVRIGSKPASGAEVRYFSDRLANPDVPHISDSGKSTADAEGRFVLDRVVPGDVRVARSFSEGSERRAWSNGTLVVVRAGETTRAEVGGKGRTVVARIVPPEGFDPKADYTIYSQFEIESDRPHIPYPEEVRARRDESTTAWAKRWWTSAEGREYRRNWFRLGQAKLQPDGTIRAEDVPPGEYRFHLTYLTDPIYASSPEERVAYAARQFTIPELAEGHSDEPFDLGVLRPKPKQTLRVGDEAPPFSVQTLDGQPLNLEDFRGKYVLLDFWATWCGPCIAEIPHLRDVFDAFGDDDRFVMISLSLDDEIEEPRAFVAQESLGWIQGFLGPWSDDPVTQDYHVEGIPAIFLIDPEGKVVATNLRQERIRSTVASFLGGAQD